MRTLAKQLTKTFILDGHNLVLINAQRLCILAVDLGKCR